MISIYANIAPYLSNPDAIKKFLEKNKDKSPLECIPEIEREMKNVSSILKTDFQILLNELEKDM